MTKEFTTEEIFDLIDKEAKDLGIQVIVDEKLPLELYWSFGSECAGCASAVDFSIHVFMETLRAMIDKFNNITAKFGRFAKFTDWGKDPQKHLAKIINKLLVHEARHLEQYHYLQSKGIDPIEYLSKHSKTNYWLRRFELDAYLVQFTGIRLPLKWALGV